ncbi:MAG: paraquat-inducible protein A [Proteobacteria bacterium]|nr:paraquat-inducible protein A [Desulfobacula sp.]MBU3950673.1 paraquat-inducible protein A [Pseudomonadota bacterium]MBU4129917.1 paraquat-inducible protein A [Pseudomonadota bacterium]
MNLKKEKGSSHPGSADGEWIACHECDLLHMRAPVPEGGKALCTRCGAFLYQNIPNSIDRSLALYLAAFMLLIMANCFPFLSLKISGRFVENYFLSGALMLYRQGMGEVGLLVLVTSVVFPFLTITGMLYVLLPIKFGYKPWHMPLVYRLVKVVKPWSLVSVFMLGVLISFVKLLDLATILPGISMYSFIGLMVVLAAAQANLDASSIWQPIPMEHKKDTPKPFTTAFEHNLIACHTCALLVSKANDDPPHNGNCPRCNTPVNSRKTNSCERTWALILSASLLFIPANFYPVMTVIKFGKGSPNTILGGVIDLIEGGMWILALIIFFASIVIPVLKIFILSFLLVSIQKKTPWRSRDRSLLFRVTEVVGAWSMVDIYVVAVMAGLVNLGALSTIRPGIGVIFFGAVVVITMFAAHSFDPRLIWDNAERIT